MRCCSGLTSNAHAWLVLAHVLKQRWAGRVQADERDARIALVAEVDGRVVGHVLLGALTHSVAALDISLKNLRAI